MKRFLSALLLVAIIHFVSYSEIGKVLCFTIFGFGVLLFFVNVKYAFQYYFLSLLLFDDSSKYDDASMLFDSIYTVQIFGFSISMLWSILVFVLLVILVLKKKIYIAKPIYVLFFLGFIGFIRIYQFKNPMFVSDVAFVINILTGYFLAIVLINSKKSLINVFGHIIMIFIAKYLFFDLLGIVLSLQGILHTIKAESAANLVIVPFLFLLMVLFGRRKIVGHDRIIAILWLLFLIAFLFITISRGRIVFVVLSLILYMIIYKKVKILLYSTAIVALIFVLISTFNENMYNFVYWKLTSFLPNSNNTVNPSVSVRVIEFENIWNEQIDNPLKLFFGSGWGGYFNTVYAQFSEKILGDSSYPESWIISNKFYKPHGTILYTLLKYGLFGTILFYGSIYYFGLKNIFNSKISALINHKEYGAVRITQVVLSISILIFTLIIFTSKLQILTGFIFYMILFANLLLTNKIKRA